MSTRQLISLILAALALYLALVLSNHPQHWLPAEFPMILLALLAFGSYRGVKVALFLLLVISDIWSAADLISLQMLGRKFDPVADLALIGPLTGLLASSFGRLAAITAVLAAILLLALGCRVIWWSIGVWAALRPGLLSKPRTAATVAAGLCGFALLGSAAPSHGMIERVGAIRQGIETARSFRAEIRDDPISPALRLDLLDADLMVIFVESYGRTSFDTAFFAQKHLGTLRRTETALAASGLVARSGFLTSPTHGGQSWLAHATFANGLWIANQVQYRAALASGRRTVFHIAQQAGFETAAIVPGITRPWPEAARMGFDRVMAAADLGYGGAAFNWVTMPDQFTLAASERLLPRQDGKRLATQIVLISSHAPWVPVPRLLDWDRIGDGRVFDEQARSGDSPETVWRDRDRVRMQYREAIDYSLNAALQYCLRHAHERRLVVLLGDHQAASSIGLDDRREVPVHVIGPADLVGRTAEWGLAPGLVPPTTTRALPMERMRDLILRSYSSTTKAPPA